MRILGNLARLGEFLPMSPELEAELLNLLRLEAGGRAEAAYVLSIRGIESARPDMEYLLVVDPSPRLRAELVAGLGRLGVEPSLSVLGELVDNPLPTQVSLAIIRVVGACPSPAADAILVRLATGPDVIARAAAIASVGLDHPLAETLILQGLADPAAEVRRSAISTSLKGDRTDLLANVLESEEHPELRALLSGIELPRSMANQLRLSTRPLLHS